MRITSSSRWVLLGKGVEASSMSSTERIPSVRFFWTALGQIFHLRNHPARQGSMLFGAFLIYSLTEIDRALDNLNKSGKLFNTPLRRESMPMVGAPRSFPEFGNISKSLNKNRIKANGRCSDPRLPGMAQRHSISDYDPLRSQSGSNLQNYYANQRHQARPNEAEQMMQAKRRMAAQRERELRNYHQEQQYNRSTSLLLEPIHIKFANAINN